MKLRRNHRQQGDLREPAPSRVPGDGRMMLEATAGDLQLTRPRAPHTLRPMGRRVATEERRHTIYLPGSAAPVSGVYNVVDRRGNYLGRQVTCHQSSPFPPTTGLIARALAFGYVLAYEAAHPYRDDEMPPPAESEHACVAGDPFPPTDPGDSRAYGYALRYEAKRLVHNWTVVDDGAAGTVDKGDGHHE